MWEWIANNWTVIVLLLVVLACPLMHAAGGCHGRRHRHGPPAEKKQA